MLAHDARGLVANELVPTLATTSQISDTSWIKPGLSFLGAGSSSLRAFADTPESAAQPEKISDTTSTVSAADTIELTLAPAGGYAAALSSRL
jgi:hypothetical protein